MQVVAYKTKLIRSGDDWQSILLESLPSLEEGSVVAVASKLVATCEGRFVAKQTGSREEKHALVEQEAEWYLPASASKYDVMFTIKGNWMFANSGIDESNADGQYLLWPLDPQQSANAIWEFLKGKYNLQSVGVVISDSHSMPLNWGVVGHAIAHCGFSPLKSYIGQPDLFGRPMKMEQTSVVQSLTVAASLTMGEGAEQTPLAVVTDLGGLVEFVDHVPTTEELAALHIDPADDMYAPLLTAVPWRKGGKAR